MRSHFFACNAQSEIKRYKGYCGVMLKNVTPYCLFHPPPLFGHDFSRIPVKPSTVDAIQAKLSINKPRDKYEQEADRVAEHVMRMPEPKFQKACTCGGACSKCKAAQLSEEMDRLQTKRLRASVTEQDSAQPIVQQVLRSPGQSLDAATLAFMESRFNHGFSRIRVHTDSRAGESARAMNARAYTVGTNIVFGTGQYAPGTSAGKQLLAHELTHTLQQGLGIASHIQRSSDTEAIGTPEPGKPKCGPDVTDWFVRQVNAAMRNPDVLDIKSTLRMAHLALGLDSHVS